MTNLRKAVVLSILLASLSGCSILSPGKKEFLQKEVPAYPQKQKIEEEQRKAADFVAVKVTDAYEEGIKAGTTNSVMLPLGEAKIVAVPLAASLGRPEKPFEGSGAELAAEMSKMSAKYEGALRKLEGKLDQLEGKDIEGTGKIQMGYFTYIAILFGIVCLLWFVLKIVSVFNPPVALGMQAVSAGTGLLRRGFGEVIEAGEKFKDMVKKKVDDPDAQKRVLELFRQAHLETQSRDVQDVIKTLTTDEDNVATVAKRVAGELKG